MIRYVSVVIGVCLNVSMACGNQCYQLVPYEPRHVNVILPTFHEEQRSFNLADKEWIIEQQWSDIGVAAVVWEAVSCISVASAILYLLFIIGWVRESITICSLCLHISGLSKGGGIWVRTKQNTNQR